MKRSGCGSLILSNRRNGSASEQSRSNWRNDNDEEEEKMSARILIVDDAAFMRMMLKDILTKNGFDIVGEAENGAVAVSKYMELKPELTVMDITMPEMDGLQAVKEIRKLDPQARIIMCSAMGQQSMVIEAIQCGAKDFVVKPFQPDRVLEAVNKALK
jgi:two-component system chemotaxis response regulator CheY